MSSFYEDASLVMIPSGYKTSKVYCAKPTDGTGDLTFTRSNDTATRVASNGLIEKVRTNLLLQSNTFDTTWTTTGSSVTSGQAGYDGTSNAWLLTRTATSGYLVQSLVQSTLGVVSVYVKANANNWFRIRVSATASSSAFYDLSNGTLGTFTSGQIATITSVGNGWYRCTLTYSPTSSDIRIYVADADNDVSGSSGSVFIQAAQWELGDIATDYIPTTTAAVSVGPVANVPRLDYLNSTCPKLLLEPQRSSLTNFSEQFDNAYWSKVGTTILANNTTSPDGYANADKLTSSGAGGDEYIQRMGFTTTAGTYTSSIFVKNVNATATVLMAVHIGEGSITSDLRYTWSTNTFTLTGTNAVSGKATSYGNGWVRLEFTYTIGALVTGHWFRTYVQTGVSTNSIFIYGAQVELGAYATSYIPTLAASVTRGADAASKTGISSLIGQTQGVVFVDYNYQPHTSAIEIVLSMQGATSASLLEMYHDTLNRIVFGIYNGGSAQATFTTAAQPAGRYKIAFAYKANDFAMYLNGVQVHTDNSGSVPALSSLGLGFDIASSGFTLGQTMNQALLFKTRLTNQELLDLTTL